MKFTPQNFSTDRLTLIFLEPRLNIFRGFGELKGILQYTKTDMENAISVNGW
jgi:hypothetical protein